MPTLEVFEKQPGERLDYDVDYTRFFDESDDDDIDGSGSLSGTVTLPPGVSPGLNDLIIDGAPIALGGVSSRRAKVWLKNGISGRTYKVTVVALTHNGRRIETDFKVKVKEI